LTILLMVGVRTEAHIFRSQVGIGSESDCLLRQLKERVIERVIDGDSELQRWEIEMIVMR